MADDKVKKTKVEGISSLELKTLNNVSQIPLLGYGTFMCSKDEIKRGIKAALAAGYRHIDCAWIYFNEAEIGEALEEVFQDPSAGITRQDIFITSKLSASHKKKESVRPAFMESLRNLRLEYMDLFLVHAPFCWDPEKKQIVFHPMEETWKECEKLVEEGLVKHIGVSNFNVQSLCDLLSYAKIKPVNNQIERHPFLVQNGLVDFCTQNNITVTAYAPLGAPGAEGRSKQENEPSLLKNSLVTSLASKYKKTAAQILLRFQLDSTPPVIVIPKSLNEDRIRENFAISDFCLEPEDMKALNNLQKTVGNGTGWRYFDQSWTGVKVFD